MFGGFGGDPVPIYICLYMTSWEVLLLLQEPPPEDYRYVLIYV